MRNKCLECERLALQLKFANARIRDLESQLGETEGEASKAEVDAFVKFVVNGEAR